MKKTLISVNDLTWGEVKKYATVQDLSLNSAVDHLLTMALHRAEYVSKDMEGNDSKVDSDNS
jgi:hypothetical protein